MLNLHSCCAASVFWTLTSPPVFSHQTKSQRSGSNRSGINRRFHHTFTNFQKRGNTLFTNPMPCSGNIQPFTLLDKVIRRTLYCSLSMGFDSSKNGRKFDKSRLIGVNLSKLYICSGHVELLSDGFMKKFGCLNPFHINLRKDARPFCELLGIIEKKLEL